MMKPNDSNPQPSSLTAALRSETAHAHAAIEAQLDLFKPGLTINRYASLLRQWLAFFATWEPLAAPWFAPLGDFFPRRSKTQLLIQDLVACGHPATPAPCDLDNIRPADYATALGTLYVVEGSTLGGRLVAPQICAILPLTVTQGVSFYNSYGANIGPYWQETKRLIDQTLPENHQPTITAAKNTFAWLQNALPHPQLP